METAELIDGLSRPEAYPHHVQRVETLHTHISVLFFAAERVYKVKKPVNPGFLDFSTLEKRLHFCREEVRLNSRLSPEMYLGVVPITIADDGSPRIGGDGEPVEYAVSMLRLPAHRMLSAMLRRAEIDNALLDRLARRLASFHASAATGPGVEEFGAPEQITRRITDVLDQTRSLAEPHDARRAEPDREPPLSTILLEHLIARAKEFLDANRALLQQRIDDGRIREGHGDLHAGNICVLGERFLIYDCIEFSRRLRCCDAAHDIAFLAMDLDSRGFRGFSRYLTDRYAHAAHDDDARPLVPFYKSHLAAVRGMVAWMRSRDDSQDQRSAAEALRESARYYQLAATYNLRPPLVLTCGLPGTGKSFAARALAEPFEAALLRSDVVRKRLAGMEPTDRHRGGLDTGIYTPEFTDRTYEQLATQTAKRLDDGRAAVVDATFRTARWRSRFARIAERAGSPLVVVHLTCPEEVVLDRLRRRAHDREEVSDADERVYRHARKVFEPPTEVPAENLLELPGTLRHDQFGAALLEHLIRRGHTTNNPR